ncbi:NUDIX hydrolase [Roseivivax sediminis]|uniref:8-oxo-dGTP diphosphatase n=1 Tax=Roseivivax sediminis TaxID=936889 RepID=A0A1I2CBL3_9RHOB|nr:NUDIX hydrolase [Roseivivax sediminis]SFE65729.1 8-oxo-dGTP diphosphatase [Roseivivax sediminis]
MCDDVIRAALAVVIRESRTLLVRRRNKPDAGLWGFPGGKLEPGESVEDAAVRELQEETGLVSRAVRRLGTFRVDHVSPPFRLDAVLCEAPSGEPVAADDAEEVAWFDVNEVVAGRLLASRDVDRLALRAALNARPAQS